MPKGYSAKANKEWRKKARMFDTRRIPSDEELIAEFNKMKMPKRR